MLPVKMQVGIKGKQKDWFVVAVFLDEKGKEMRNLTMSKGPFPSKKRAQWELENSVLPTLAKEFPEVKTQKV